MSLQTQHTLVCNGCDREKKGKCLDGWVELVWEVPDWVNGYSAISGYTFLRHSVHACSPECLSVVGARIFPKPRAPRAQEEAERA